MTSWLSEEASDGAFLGAVLPWIGYMATEWSVSPARGGQPLRG